VKRLQLLTIASVGTLAMGLLTWNTMAQSNTQHYEYVFPDGHMLIYDMDSGQTLVKQVSLPTTAGVRGVAVDPGAHTLYVSYGGDGGGNGNGSLLKYDLLSNSMLWSRNYSHGIDSFAINPAGTRIYMPDGELTSNGLWYVVDTATGNELGSINGGLGPHNTIVSLTGTHVYLGGRNRNYLEVADPTTDRVIKNIGPLRSGVRPFTINGRETLAFTTATGFLGFQVSNISTGQVLYTVPVAGFPCCGAASAPSHGISLSPDEKEIYLVDSVSSYIHVFDVSGLPAGAPRQVADIKLVHPMSGYESGCAYDCLKDGWVQHSRDGRFAYVGDSGDVIATATRSIVGYLPALGNTRKMLEVDWSNGLPTFTTSRTGLGYALTAPTATPMPTPRPTPTPTPTPTPYPVPGSALYSANFENDTIGSAPIGWTVANGGPWTVQLDGTKVLASGGIFGHISAGSQSWTDYAVSVDVKPTTYNAGYAGVGGRYVSSTAFYACVIANHAHLQLYRVTASGMVLLAGTAATINTSTFTTITLTMQGSRLSCSLVGGPTIQATDGTYLQGQVGLVANYGEKAEFDNVWVTP
jgi:hypothetical protein